MTNVLLQDNVIDKNREFINVAEKISPRRRFLYPFLLLTVAWGVSNVIFQIIWILSVVRYGTLFITTGSECLNIYAIWKLTHGFQLYELPFQYPYSFTPYNYLLYYIVNVLSFVFRGGAGDQILMARLFVLVMTAWGAIVHWLLLCRLTRNTSGMMSLLLLMFSVAIWFNTGEMGAFIISVRPDIPAVALATLGLLFYLLRVDGLSMKNLAYSSLAFYLAWAFKQVTVWMLMGVVLHAIFFRRKMMELLFLVLPCGLLMLLSIVLGGHAYRYSIIYAQAINHVYISAIIYGVYYSLKANLFLWLWGPCVLLLWKGLGNGKRVGWSGLSGASLMQSELGVLIVVSIVSFGMGSIALGREGSSSNHLVEAFIAVSSLSVYMAILICGGRLPYMRLLRLVGVLLMGLSAVVSARKLLPSRISTQIILRDDYAAREKWADFVLKQKPPVWTNDEILSLPHYSNNDHYPSPYTLDVYYNAALRKGVIKGGGVIALIKRQDFATIITDPRDEYFSVALQSGYVQKPIPCTVVSDTHTMAVDKVLLVRSR